MTTLTHNQSLVLIFIEEFTEKNGFPPTHAEIARHMGWRSINAATEHLDALQRKGKIKRRPGVPRSITIVREDGASSEDVQIDRLLELRAWRATFRNWKYSDATQRIERIGVV